MMNKYKMAVSCGRGMGIYKWGQYPPMATQFQIMVLSGGRLSVTYINEKGQNNNDE